MVCKAQRFFDIGAHLLGSGGCQRKAGDVFQ